MNVAGAGVFLLGGAHDYEKFSPGWPGTSLVLSPGGSWERGPSLSRPTDYTQMPIAKDGCSVAWGGSLLIVGGWPNHNQVLEYNTVAGRWEEDGKWPQLGGKGRAGHGCSLLGSQLVVAGGWDSDRNVLSTTDTLDLASGPKAVWLEGGRLNTPRYRLAMVTVGAAGRERLYALGGRYNRKNLDTVERWEEGARRWQVEEERLLEGRSDMGAVAVTEEVCNN